MEPDRMCSCRGPTGRNAPLTVAARRTARSLLARAVSRGSPARSARMHAGAGTHRPAAVDARAGTKFKRSFRDRKPDGLERGFFSASSESATTRRQRCGSMSRAALHLLKGSCWVVGGCVAVSTTSHPAFGACPRSPAGRPSSPADFAPLQRHLGAVERGDALCAIGGAHARRRQSPARGYVRHVPRECSDGHELRGLDASCSDAR